MSRMPGIQFLHSPGPTHLPRQVLDAMHRQAFDLGDPRVNDLIAAEEALKLAGAEA